MDGDTDYLCKLCLVRQEDRSEEELRGVDDVEINLFGFDVSFELNCEGAASN